jgi:enoyl-CoA hydratase
MPEFVLVDSLQDVALVTLNRPEVLNAWHAAMREEVVEVFAQLDANPAVRAIVLTGAGERAFGAGQDLNESKTFDADHTASWMDEWKRLYNSVRKCSKPTVIALNGVCAGSAFQIALMADFRIAHPDVRMGQPEINSGVASTVGPWIMRELLGLSRSVDLALTGRLLQADECLSLGLINKIVSREDVLPSAIAFARELSQKPPTIMRLNKQRFIEMTEAGFLSAIEAGERNQREAYLSGESVFAMEAFLSRKKKTPT